MQQQHHEKNNRVSFYSTIFRKFFHIFPYIIIFLAALNLPIDPDLGWHLKYGEYFILNHEVLISNIFSSMMPNFFWINTSVGNDVVVYLIFQTFGFFGIMLLGSFCVTLTFYFFARSANLSLWNIVTILPFIFYLNSSIIEPSFRPQIFSYLFLAVLYFLLSEYTKGKTKIIFLIIPLFLLWTNLHGEFVLGLAIYSLWIFFYCITFVIQRRKILIREVLLLIFVLVSSLSITLINPFGITIYHEVLNHFSNSYTKYVFEWQPFPIFTILFNFTIVVMILVLVNFWLSKQKIKLLPFLFITIILFILTLSSRRYAWPFFYTAIPLLVVVSDKFKPKDIVMKHVVIMFVLFIFSIFIFIIKNPFYSYRAITWNDYCNSLVRCSPKAAQFLIDNKLNNKNLYTYYNWGGWLIWNYPQIKPTIDGRMTLWRDDKGYSATQEYFDIGLSVKDINKTKYDVIFVQPEAKILTRLSDLIKQKKWEIVYVDRNSVIVKKLAP